MIKRKKAAKKKMKSHSHDTAHRRAMANPKVRKKIEVLRRRWKSMNPVDRGDRLRELAALKCSTWGLEEELKQSATSIRRHIAIAKLPEEDRKAIEAGFSAKKILAQKAAAERERQQQERIAEDRETGVPSDELATLILEFCRAKEGGNRVSRYGEPARRLLDETLTTLLRYGASNVRVPPVSKKLGMRGLLKRTKPPLDQDIEWMGYQAQWLARAILARAPERPIWENAIEKAEKRIGELTPPPKPLGQSWGEIKYTDLQPPRPIYKGARSMKRPG